MVIYKVNDKEFEQFGKVLDIDTKEIIETAEKTELPKEGSLYTASREDFENLPVARMVREECFGGLPVQLGYCYGHNDTLNALEWHKCSEVNIAVTDFILLLGDVRDIESGNKYNSEKVKAFKVLKGEAIEVYSTTLHFCPLETEKSGFGCVVGLVKGTNIPLDFEPNDKLLFRKNKWLLAHRENKALIEKGVVSGIYGTNIKL